LANNNRRSALAAGQERRAVIEREAALLLVARVALAAVLAQDWHDVVSEINWLRILSTYQRRAACNQNADEQKPHAEAQRSRGGAPSSAKRGGQTKSRCS